MTLKAKLVGTNVVILLTLVAHVAFAQARGRIAYTVGYPDFAQLRLTDGVRDLPVSPRIQIGGVTASVVSTEQPAWSKDGRLIVVNVLLAGPVTTPTKILAVLDSTTGRGNAVFDVLRGKGPVSAWWINAAFSPDGNRLLYAANQLNFVEYGIINRDGTGQIPLFFANLTSDALGVGVDWSPRTDQLGNFGNLLVVSYSFLDFSCHGVPRTMASLYLVKLTPALAAQQLTRPVQPPCYLDPLDITGGFDSVHDRYPVFSPNGTHVAFVRTVENSNAQPRGSAIMVVPVNGAPGTERQLASLPGEMVMDLSWSPDGSELGFHRVQVFTGLDPEVAIFAGTNLNPLGVWSLRTDGSGLIAPLLGPQAWAPAWGR